METALIAPRLDAAEEPTRTARWGQDRRLEFIDFRLRWDGRLNRSDLVDFFGISVPQASLDIARYIEEAPGNIRYDRGARLYRATDNFSPLFAANSSSRYLNELLSLAAGILAPEASFVGWRPSVATAPVPYRTLNPDVLIPLLRSIRAGSALRVRYQSMTRPEATVRTISPHALATDGFRWHVRAYCYERAQFRDFVVARILAIKEQDLASESAAGPELDAAWSQEVKLVIAPHPNLSEAHRRVVELDYAMSEGQTTMSCRKALLLYALRNLGLLDEVKGGPSKPPTEQHIVLRNCEEVAASLELPIAG